MQVKTNLKPTKSVKSKFVTKCNPRLPKIDGIIKKNISIVHNDDALKTIFLKSFLVPFLKEIKIWKN